MNHTLRVLRVLRGEYLSVLPCTDDTRLLSGYYAAVRPFPELLTAEFLSRPNRFVVVCRLGMRTVRAYLPNPGRLWELLFPGTTVYLARFPPSPERRLRYLAAAVERDGMPIMLHTHYTNAVAARLLSRNLVSGLEGATIVKQEHAVGNSRFDFLLRKDGRDILLEVKSCTLFHDTLAMFPDAVSARATKHLRELEALSRRGIGAAVLFVVHSPRVTHFMPEHHTDLEFCRALIRVKDRVMVRAVSVGWMRNLSLAGTVRMLAIPWSLVEREARDRGSYIIVMKLERDRTIEVGSLGRLPFRKGFYLYVGSARKNLAGRIARHQRLRKKLHWHIDYLREQAEFTAAIPIRSSEDLECALAGRLADLAGWRIPGFGCSDCSCPSHLFGMAGDPFRSREFIAALLDFRMGRLEREIRDIDADDPGAHSE